MTFIVGISSYNQVNTKCGGAWPNRHFASREDPSPQGTGFLPAPLK